MWKWILALLAASFVAAVTSAGYWVYKQVDEKQQVSVERLQKFKNRKPRNDLPHIGYLAPKFELPAENNQTVGLNGPHHQPTLVVFWSSWSSHCQKELVLLDELYRQNGKNLRFYLVNDTTNDDPKEAEQLLLGKSLKQSVLYDRDGKVVEDYGIEVYPTAFLVGTDGKIKDRWVGTLTLDEWKEKLVNLELSKK
ncbi:TlpA family protein disulfide reductase [Brevibacillus sp. H7]|uniref:TlpA family protein disulfide reductase n=1 Tax=Brevibacillus sp. H7 TaxID=3349138 RepID=UPI0037F4A63D